MRIYHRCMSNILYINIANKRSRGYRYDQRWSEQDRIDKLAYNI